MDKNLSIKLNGSRCIVGTLRGYDMFLNLTLENTVLIIAAGKNLPNNKVQLGSSVIRGNTILSIEVLDKI